ncbi:pyridoxal phosphate-dependent decarboxylase family protein [Micromonospora endophytica]|uniref:Aspartate aminotransferase family protein n=1 Tax=Micromonospora endophytica TaxID=515350 RepID=A0A2W2BAF4_9ACTN|nr:aminotransferase class V-fold PLP-dependent enzyme [Micromonospora endophytica]PZF83102.1 aspartate aminotransferase family protein [Micromonospora endophytica]RIW43095.1 aspartate aminotransferase family protein [Micromonospora endophytica]BCJ60110.1 aspartate aminotransferase family protein [Micromonospora endophytica]
MIDESGSALPAHGVPAEQVLAEVRRLREADRPTHGGRLFAYVYDAAVAGLDELAAAAYAESAHVNGLDPTAFPSLLAMENALVGAAARVLGGGPGTSAPEVVGSVTSGGTESLILAVKAARDARPEITAPRIVVPASAHAAFAKAAHYLRVALDPVPVDPTTLRPAVADVAAAITPETVLVVCSAPSYAHGVVDPVAEIAQVAAAAGVRCHVDACFGGWTLPYLRRLGVPVPAFDFAVPGVTSISVDLHKYAYAPKGVSVLLHRDPALRAPQYFAYADWPGYTMVNPVISSTRSGGPIAAAYATLRHLGDDGYLELTRRTWDAVRVLADAVRDVEGLRLVAEPESSVVCLTSTDPELDLFVLVDELTARGWHTQPQLAYAGLPRSVHLTVTAAVAPRAAEFGSVLADAAAAARAAGPVTLPPELLALAGSLTPEALTPELVAGLADGLGLAGKAGPPERMAVVNTLLDAAPVALRERLLVEFVGLLQRPTY